MGFSDTAAHDIRILSEDDHLVVAVKPPGLPTANAPRGTESLFTILKRRPGQGAFLGVVSRLDAPVSGVVVLAKTPRAAASLAAAFRERTVEKSYAAIVTGRFPAALGEWVDWHDSISRPREGIASQVQPGSTAGGLSDDDGDPGDHDDPGEDGRPAHTRCRVVRRAGEVSLVELRPTTGRRHQLRAQLAARGCPIVGDRRYGSRLPCRSGGIALHAERLAFVHPATGESLEFTAPSRDRWAAVFASLFPAADIPPKRG